MIIIMITYATPQDTLVRRLGPGAVPFCFTLSSLAPPSVTLLPARNYSGAPIGTNYDLRVFVGGWWGECRWGITLLQYLATNKSSLLLSNAH